jgi:hypothetical protein
MTGTKSNERFEAQAAYYGMLRNLTKVMLYAAGRTETVEKVML